jgi:hypothetical protein
VKESRILSKRLQATSYDFWHVSILFLMINMPLSRLSLNTLRAFDAAARHLNFTRAADELCVTQAAVSHQVKALEEHIGRPLFRRTARGLVLTDEGSTAGPHGGRQLCPH